MTELELNLVRLCGLIGIFGSFTIMITDWIGWLKRPQDEALRYDGQGIKLSKAARHFYLPSRGISGKRREYASWIGGIAMAPTALGFVTMAVLLLPAGPFLAYGTLACMVGFFMGGVMGHTSMGIVNRLFESTETLDPESEAYQVTARNIENTLAIIAPFLYAMLAPFLIAGSFLYSYTVFFEQTHYPRWMGAFNFFLILGLFRFHIIKFPYAISRWTTPALVHLFATLPFLIISTILVWNGV